MEGMRTKLLLGVGEEEQKLLGRMISFWSAAQTNRPPVVFESRLNDGFGENYVFSPLSHAGGGLPYSSLVLDSERGELVRAPGKLGKKTGKTEAKAIAALKNHSEAERRRRERINSHLNTLRNLVPSTDKMDKASLLAEVIKHVKELKRSTTDACEGYIIPMDIDEVTVEPHEEEDKGLFCIKASLCCEDRPEIFRDLRQALDTFNLKTVKAEMSTLGGRMKNVFVLAGFNVDNIDDVGVRRSLMNSVHQTMTSILDKYSAPTELSPTAFLPNKRRRFSVFDSSSSSS